MSAADQRVVSREGFIEQFGEVAVLIRRRRERLPRSEIRDLHKKLLEAAGLVTAARERA